MNYKIKTILFTIILFFVVGCNDPLSELSDYKQTNACLPQAIICKKALAKQGVWSKVLVYYYKEERDGHAICVYKYAGKLWTYDHAGSYDVRVEVDRPLEVAQAAENRRMRYKKVISAWYLD